MTELSFAKSILSSLDARPFKIQPDHAADPKTFEPKGPYTLPRMPTPMHRPTKASPPGSLPTTTITLKSLRNPPLSLSLPAQSLSTSVHDLKTAVAKEIGVEGTGNIRVLYKKRPCADSKTVKDVLGDEETGQEGVEFSIMVLGGVAEGEKDVKALVAQGASGEEVIVTDEFWGDLRGFLMQRIRDEATAEEMWMAFKGVWKGREQSESNTMR